LREALAEYREPLWRVQDTPLRFVILEQRRSPMALELELLEERALLSTTPTQIYVASLYHQLLQRDTDPAGLAYWSAKLDAGEQPSQVVQEIQASSEYQTLELQNLYHQLLGRTGELAGVQSWTRALNAGLTIEQVEGGFLGSPEYFQKAGGTNTGFLTALYQDVLDRPVDQVGAAAWGALLQSGVSRLAIALTVEASAEAKNLELTNLNKNLLGGPEQPSGPLLAGALPGIPLSPGVSDATIMNELFNQDFSNWEWIQRDKLIAQDYGDGVYRSYLSTIEGQLVNFANDTPDVAAHKVENYIAAELQSGQVPPGLGRAFPI